MSQIPSQCITASRFFNRTTSTLAAFGALLLMFCSMPLQAAPLPFFPDPAMQQCLDEQAVANGWVNAEDVTVFNCVDRGVQSIQGVEAFINLSELDVSNNNIGDINPLTGFTGLRILRLSNNSYIDASRAEQLVNQNPGLIRLGLAGVRSSYPQYWIPSFPDLFNTLIELDLSNANLQNINGIEQYSQLEILKLADNGLVEIDLLGQGNGLLQLKELDLSNNRLFSVAGLNNYTTLIRLNISGNQAIEFWLVDSIIQQNPGLTHLGLAGVHYPLSTFPFLPALFDTLIELDFSNTGIHTLNGIEQFSQLQILRVANNNLSDIAALGLIGPNGALPLKELDLSNNNLSNVSELNNFTSLISLHVSENTSIDYMQIESIINQNMGLTRLGLADIQYPFQTIPNFPQLYSQLVELDISNTGINTIAGIEQYGQLEILRVADNTLMDIGPLGVIGPNGPLPLKELDLSNNRLIDVAALNNFTGLTSLYASSNLAIDFTQIEPIINQNLGLTRLGLGGVQTPYQTIPNFPHLFFQLVELDISNTGIADISGIFQYSKLQVLRLADNKLAEIRSGSFYGPYGLPLQVLDLSNNNLINIEGLNDINGLSSLYFSGNSKLDYSQIDTIIQQNQGLKRLGLAGINNVQSASIPSAVINLAWNLVELDMSNTGLHDVSGIEQFQKLEILKLADNQIQDISPLSQLSMYGPPWLLRELDLSSNNISDISALAGFYGLTALNLSGNTGIDYTTLLPVIQQNHHLHSLGLGSVAINGPFPVYFDIYNKPYNLVELDLSNTGIADLWGVEQYANLQLLNVSGNNLTNINALGMYGPYGLLPLRKLDLSNNSIVDVAPLSNFVDLQSLWISGNPAINFQQLYPILDQNNQLTRIGLGDIAINGPMPLFMNQMTWQPYNLVELDLSNTGLLDLPGLEQYDELLSLDISGNSMINISHLGYLYNHPLQKLNLANTNIVDITPLWSLSNLKYINLSGNNGIPCDQLDHMAFYVFPEATIVRPTSCVIGQLPQLSISEPQIGLMVIEGLQIYFYASAFDYENGDLSSQIQWSSDLVGVLGTGSLIPVQFSQTGIHQITATVTDLDDNTVSQTVQITVVENVAPTINIFSPYQGQSGIEGALMHASATAFDQEEGALDHAITWSSSIDGLVAIGATAELNLSLGDHVLTATVTDSFGKSTSQTVPVTIIFNNPPVVTIFNPVSGSSSLEGVSTTLAASAIDYEDGGLASINWQSDLQGDLGTGIDLNVNLTVGVHTITASVTDTLGKTGIHVVSYEVIFNNPPVLNIASPVNGGSIIEGESTLLTASAVDIETGDISPLVNWSSDLQGPLGTGSSLTVNLNVGNHVITALVADAQGKTSVQTVSMTVVFNNPPVLTISSPVDNSTSIEGTTINLVAAVVDTEDGDLSINTRWSSDVQGYLGMGSNLPVSLQVGVHNITATVTDSHGKTTTQTIVSTVLFNNPPVLTLAPGIDDGSSEDGLAVQLSATALDIESGDLGGVIAWSSDISGSLGVGSNLSVMLPIGVHTLTAMVMDTHGKSHTLTAQHTVVEAPMLTYCEAFATDTSKEWIESVSMSGVTNTSGSQLGYGDYWNLRPIYLDRTSNTISLTPGYSNDSRDEYWKIWVDFNRDGVFSDNEVVVTESAIGTLTGSFAISADAVTGNTRMRIVMKHNKPGSACGSYKHGEVEDYRVIIQP